jgi:hypothetical protein
MLSGDKKLLREGSEVDLISNQKGNYEQLKLILIRLKCMCISPALQLLPFGGENFFVNFCGGTVS